MHPTLAYALPPIERLRFAGPVYANNWVGQESAKIANLDQQKSPPRLDATKPGKHCVQAKISKAKLKFDLSITYSWNSK